MNKSNILLAGIFSILVALGFFLYFSSRVDTIMKAVKTGRTLSLLLTITDDKKPIITELFLYHPKTKRSALVNIPGEVGSIIASLNRVDRIDSLYTRGNLAPFVEKISALVGVPIDYFIDFSLTQVTGLVDLVGGVRIFISNPIEHMTPAKVVLIPSGGVILDGEKAKDYLFYNAFLEKSANRIRRNQLFVLSLLLSVGQFSDELANAKVFRYFQDRLDSNLDAQALFSLTKELSHIEPNQTLLRDTTGIVREVDGQPLLFPHFEGELLREAIQQLLSGLNTAVFINSVGAPYSVEILNGTMKDGLASRTAQLYRSFGFEVVSVGNAKKQDQMVTRVIDHRGDKQMAHKVASIIRGKVVMSEASEKDVDVTIILGEDFDGRYVGK